MKMTRNISLIVLLAVAAALMSALFTVNQTQQALVLQFGEQNAPFRSLA